jgi:predicted NBD/HSP70 family sugar kinase
MYGVGVSSVDEDDRMRPNQRRLLAALATADQLSRADLAHMLDLPKATVTDLVNDLVARELIAESEPQSRPGFAGRPSRVLSLAGPAPAIGVVVWSAGLLRVAVATRSGHILAEDTSTVTVNFSHHALLDPALEMLANAARSAGYQVAELHSVVIGVPAPFQQGVGVAFRLSATARSADWLDADPARVIGERIGTRVVIENDANLGALGEYVFGAGQGRHSVVYLKLGEHSVGAGLIINGWLHRGASGFAGELAHIQVREDGPLCPCGGRGCLIQVIGPALIDVVQPAYEQRLTYPHMLRLAADGDTGMRRILGDLGRSVGRPLADVCTMLNPDAIIVDGAVGEAAPYIMDGITEAVARHAAPATSEAVHIIAGTTGSRADILGAVALTQR